MQHRNWRVFVYLPVCLSVGRSVGLSVSLSLSFSVSCTPSHNLSLSYTISIIVSLPFSFTIFFTISLVIPLIPYFPRCLCLCYCFAQCVPFTLSSSLSLSHSSQSFTASLAIYFTPSHSLPVSLLCTALSVCLSLSLSPQELSLTCTEVTAPDGQTHVSLASASTCTIRKKRERNGLPAILPNRIRHLHNIITSIIMVIMMHG